MSLEEQAGPSTIPTEVYSEPPPSYAEALRRAQRAKERGSHSQRSINHVSRTHAEAHERSPLLIRIRPRRSSLISNHSQSDDRGYWSSVLDRACWKALLHLTVVNFPLALVAWIVLFLGVLVGTSLLIFLPIGALIWWLTLITSRWLANLEIEAQIFHYDLVLERPFRPIFRRAAITIDPEDHEPIPSTFLENSNAMFNDWEGSYIPIFHFLVIKASIALILTPAALVLALVSAPLIIPFPLALRCIHKLGLWQAQIAVDGLLI